MSSKISLLTGLISIGATISLVRPHIAIAKTSVEIGETAKAITVLITEPNSVGSGVILQQQGDLYTVITAAHVVKNKASYKITTPDDRSYQIIPNSIRSAPGSIDLAVIKFKSTSKYTIAKLGNSNALKSGMDLYVAGFPGRSKAIDQPIFIFREGKVSANSNKVLENGYSLVYSNNTLPGMSGGAVLNSNGELVAIHGRGDRDDTGAKTGFNLGIPVNRLAMVASKMGVNLDGQVTPIAQNTATKADDYLASAAQKYSKGDNRGTVADLNKAIALNPKLAVAYLVRGALKDVDLNDVRGALADYNLAIALDPKSVKAYYNRGNLKDLKLNDVQGALADFDRAIALDPKFVYAYDNRGAIKGGKLNDLRGALADFDRAIAVDPQHVNAYYNRGVLKDEKLNDVRGALADYNRAIALDPQHIKSHYNRGILKNEKLNDVQGALADYNRVIALDPKFVNAYINRGVLKNENLNDVRGAMADFDRAIALDPKSVYTYYNRGNLKYNKLNDVRGALADYNQAIALDPKVAPAYFARGVLKHHKLNDMQGAIADLNQAARLYQSQGDPKNYQSAIDYLKKIRTPAKVGN